MSSKLLQRSLMAMLCWSATAMAAEVPSTRVLDDFESVAAWSAHPADGVEVKISSDTGRNGKCMRVDFRFVKGGGYAVVRRALAIDFPDHYRFRFRIRGEAPVNNLEFKLADASGENVWWSNQRDFHFPSTWEVVTLKQRHITFAWGPLGGGPLQHAASLEFAITAGTGGAGTVWIDELTLDTLPAPDAAPPAIVTSASSGTAASRAAVDGDATTAWRSAARDTGARLTLDLGADREFDALKLQWRSGQRAAEYDVETSDDSRHWRVIRSVRGGHGTRDLLHLPDHEARWLRVHVRRGPAAGVALEELSIEPVGFAPTRGDLLQRIAKDARRGLYPRGVRGEMSYWTVVGTDDDREEGLLGEDGALETRKASFSVEPFVWLGDSLLTWADVQREQTLTRGDLPLPSVRWSHPRVRLEVSVVPEGAAGKSSLIARYRVRNPGAARLRGTLYLALRPFQVNPPRQFLNTPGGAAPIRRIEYVSGDVIVNRERYVRVLQPPAAFGAVSSDAGDVVADFLTAGRLPATTSAIDDEARASAALAYPFDLEPGVERQISLVIPMHTDSPVPRVPRIVEGVERWVAAGFEAAETEWAAKLDRVNVKLPGEADELAKTLRAQLGFILVNRDSGGVQPGSRSYERSWIRDGALTSSALLRMGHPEAAREFLDWFAPYLYSDGKVPCCVDARGSDPVPEHDSGGEFLFLLAEVVRYTGDDALARQHWPATQRVVAYYDSLRNTTRTAEYRTPEKAHFFGLLPPSISHEGYSAKAMHSYWDDLFALRGFKDAVYLAQVVGDANTKARFTRIRDEFERELIASVRASMAKHHITYIPGCADLGDFDATSTTIAFSPVEAPLPDVALRATFARYDAFFRARQEGREKWDAYTPYELRNVGAMVHLGQRDRAQEMLRWFLQHRTPLGWKQWAEVVWNAPKEPQFIGDLPHTWVGSDYARSLLDCFAYARGADSSLVVVAGAPAAWFEGEGSVVKALPTPFGQLDLTLGTESGRMVVSLAGLGRVPPGGVIVRAPWRKGARTVEVNGVRTSITPDGAVVLRHLPARVVLSAAR